MMSIVCYAQTSNPTFNKIYLLAKQKNFFRAKEVYDSNRTALSASYQNYVEALLDNAFNKTAESEARIAVLKGDFSDVLWFEMYKVKEDNAVKSYNYKEAKEVVELMLQRYKYLLSPDGQEDLENSLVMWSALERVAPQRVTIQGTNRLPMIKDKAELKNLQTVAGKDTVNLIFDTGANFSTVSMSTAKRMNMQLIPAQIAVGTITGTDIQGQLGVCKMFKLGNIKVENAVFIVLADSALSFPTKGYEISGILGFPVISAMKEVQLTQDGYLIIPEQETAITQKPNLAIDRLSPLIYIDGMHYHFDTGADETFLYSKFYEENKEEISGNYVPSRIRFGGAGSKAEVEAYKIRYKFNIMGKDIVLDTVPVLKEKLSDEKVYGNIGQDVIKQFNKMTINFDRMFIKFD